MEAREFLTGCAMIALAIESSQRRAANDAAALLRATNRLSRHEDQRNLERPEPELEPQSSHAMAEMAIGLADACLVGLKIIPPIDQDPFVDQKS
jgi:hypothetical protein